MRDKILKTKRKLTIIFISVCLINTFKMVKSYLYNSCFVDMGFPTGPLQLEFV